MRFLLNEFKSLRGKRNTLLYGRYLIYDFIEFLVFGATESSTDL